MAKKIVMKQIGILWSILAVIVIAGWITSSLGWEIITTIMFVILVIYAIIFIVLMIKISN